MYLILTASLENKEWSNHPQKREQEYRDAIQETLHHLPLGIQPVVVENNGMRATWLDTIRHRGQPVPVVYTNHNSLLVHKGIKEMMDVRAVVAHVGMKGEEWVIKLTGRYPVRSPAFFEDVLAHSTEYDAFFKFFSSSTMKYETDDCILGLYALRVAPLLCFRYATMDSSLSAEQVMARYLRFSGLRIKEIQELGLHCIFSDEGGVLDV